MNRKNKANNFYKTGSQLKLDHFLNFARNGRETDVDFLMEFLHPGQVFRVCKMIDCALGEVKSDEGQNRIRYHLFNGKHQIRRNYAALYFKRRGMLFLLEEAVQRGCIDRVQAFCR